MSTIDFILTCMIYKISRTIWWNWTFNIWGKRCSYFCKIGESDNFRREGLVPAFSSYTLSKKKKTPQTNTNLDQTNTSHLHYRTRSSLSLSSLKQLPAHSNIHSRGNDEGRRPPPIRYPSPFSAFRNWFCFSEENSFVRFSCR